MDADLVNLSWEGPVPSTAVKLYLSQHTSQQQPQDQWRSFWASLTSATDGSNIGCKYIIQTFYKFHTEIWSKLSRPKLLPFMLL